MTHEKFVVGRHQQNRERRLTPAGPDAIANPITESERFRETCAINREKRRLVLGGVSSPSVSEGLASYSIREHWKNRRKENQKKYKSRAWVPLHIRYQ